MSVSALCSQLAADELFVSRDELVAFRLPDKLSRMTRLANNHILPIPLAINLADFKAASGVSASAGGGGCGSKQAEIARVVLRCGQVLRVCGVYENILPMLDPRTCKPLKPAKLHRALSKVAAPLPAHHRHQQVYADAGALYAGSYESRAPSAEQVGALACAVERYVRCVALADASIQALTSPSSRPAPPHVADDEFEVLIPMSSAGRFYVCASKQALVDTLYGCQAPLSANLVFTLDQLATLLSLSARVGAECGNGACKTPRGRARCRRRLLQLPLAVSLVFGTRPTSYSPSMFGLSTSVDSFFTNEANIAGHLITCRFNRSCAPVLADGMPPAKTLICRCCYALYGSEPSAHFSASLRLEAIRRRNVLAGCTIKSNPLVTIDDLAKHLTAKPVAATAPLLSPRALSAAAKLEALEERTGAGARPRDGKSSFSRLRACRSLISLNGRRKQRPKIPHELLPAERCYQASPNSAAAIGERTQGQAMPKPLATTSTLKGAERVVFVEFDCEDSELKFVRTFIDSSLPAAAVPEVVLRRLELCAKLAGTWEAHLKLSYAHLAHDFNEYCRQLRLIKSRRGAGVHLAPPASLRQLPPAPTPAPQEASTGEQSRHLTAASWSTSRSSSGVSSAGERQAAAAAAVARRQGGAEDSAKSTVSSQAASTSGSSTSNRSVRSGPASKLQRFVQRLIPAGQDGKHVSLMEEMSRRFSKESASKARVDFGEPLNAKKIAERRLSSAPNSNRAEDGEHLYESLERLRVRNNRQVPDRRAAGRSDAMEPVSIEACDDQLLTMLDSGGSDDSLGGANAPSTSSDSENGLKKVHSCKDTQEDENEEEEEESLYVNLTRNSSLLALSERQSRVKMERRLQKARARRAAAGGTSTNTVSKTNSSCLSLSQMELRNRRLGESAFRSLGDFGHSDKAQHNRRKPQLATLDRLNPSIGERM